MFLYNDRAALHLKNALQFGSTKHACVARPDVQRIQKRMQCTSFKRDVFFAKKGLIKQKQAKIQERIAASYLSRKEKKE